MVLQNGAPRRRPCHQRLRVHPPSLSSRPGASVPPPLPQCPPSASVPPLIPTSKGPWFSTPAEAPLPHCRQLPHAAWILSDRLAADTGFPLSRQLGIFVLRPARARHPARLQPRGQPASCPEGCPEARRAPASGPLLTNTHREGGREGGRGRERDLEGRRGRGTESAPSPVTFWSRGESSGNPPCERGG